MLKWFNGGPRRGLCNSSRIIVGNKNVIDGEAFPGDMWAAYALAEGGNGAGVGRGGGGVLPKPKIKLSVT